MLIRDDKQMFDTSRWAHPCGCYRSLADCVSCWDHIYIFSSLSGGLSLGLLVIITWGRMPVLVGIESVQQPNFNCVSVCKDPGTRVSGLKSGKNQEGSIRVTRTNMGLLAWERWRVKHYERTRNPENPSQWKAADSQVKKKQQLNVCGRRRCSKWKKVRVENRKVRSRVWTDISSGWRTRGCLRMIWYPAEMSRGTLQICVVINEGHCFGAELTERHVCFPRTLYMKWLRSQLVDITELFLKAVHYQSCWILPLDRDWLI